MGILNWFSKIQVGTPKIGKTSKGYHKLYIIINSSGFSNKSTLGEYPTFEDSKEANEFVKTLKVRGINVSYMPMKFSEENYIELKKKGYLYKKEDNAINEAKLRGRGIKVLFWAKPMISEKDKQKLKEELLKSGMFNIFEGTWVNFYAQKNMAEIKIWCPEALFLINSSDAPKFYKELFDKIFFLVKDFLNSKKYKLKGYSFEFVFKIGVSEENIIPIPKTMSEKKKLD